MFGKPDFDAVAFGAHPDDVEICCGGTVARLAKRGYRVGVVSLTAAELGTRGDATTRAHEFANAAKILGVAHHEMLDIPDGQVSTAVKNRKKVIDVLRRLRPRIVFAPHWTARHPDHRHSSMLIQEAVFFAGLKKVDSEHAPWRPYKTIFYPNRYEFVPSFVVDISDTFALKMQAVRAYQSQFHGPEMASFGEQQTAISHPAFLDHIEIRARQYGIYIGVQYAEPFCVREPVAIDDPVSLFDERCYYTVP